MKNFSIYSKAFFAKNILRNVNGFLNFTKKLSSGTKTSVGCVALLNLLRLNLSSTNLFKYFIFAIFCRIKLIDFVYFFEDVQNIYILVFHFQEGSSKTKKH